MKRFTDTNKWDDQWFRKMTPEAKLLWMWICDKCDQAGVLDIDFEYASFQIGAVVTQATLREYGERIAPLRSGKLWVKKFVIFQYGKLSPACKPHAPVYAALQKHGLDHEEVDQNESFRELVDGAMRRRIIERDGLICVYSGNELTEAEAVIDHVIPRAKGGRAIPENLVVCSAQANSRKRESSVEEFCFTAGLDLDEVNQRLSKAFAKPIKGYQGSLKEKEKEKETEKEKAKEKEKSTAKAKTPEEVEEFAVSLGCPAGQGAAAFWKWEGNGWINGKAAIKDWRATVRAWKAQGYAPFISETAPAGKPVQISFALQDKERKEAERHGPEVIVPKIYYQHNPQA